MKTEEIKKNFIVAFVCLTLIYAVTTIILVIRVDYYKKELDRAIMQRNYDLQTTQYWIEKWNER